MSIVTVKIQFDNTGTYEHALIQNIKISLVYMY